MRPYLSNLHPHRVVTVSSKYQMWVYRTMNKTKVTEGSQQQAGSVHMPCWAETAPGFGNMVRDRTGSSQSWPRLLSKEKWGYWCPAVTGEHRPQFPHIGRPPQPLSVIRKQELKLYQDRADPQESTDFRSNHQIIPQAPHCDSQGRQKIRRAPPKEKHTF